MTKKQAKQLRKRIRRLEARITALEHSTWWPTPTPPAEMPADCDPKQLWADIIADYDKVVDTGWDDEWDEIPPQRNGYL